MERVEAEEKRAAVDAWHAVFSEAFAPTKRLGLLVANNYNTGNYEALSRSCRGLALAVTSARRALPADEIPDAAIALDLGRTLVAYGRDAVECQRGRLARGVWFGSPNGIRTRVASLKGWCPDLARRWGHAVPPGFGVGRLGPDAPCEEGRNGECSAGETGLQRTGTHERRARSG